MKRFLAGLVVGLSVSGLTLLAQHLASENIVQPQPIFENQRVKVQRWVLKPGEGTPLHAHTLDHISVVLQGSAVKDMGTDGSSKTVKEQAGQVAYVPGTGRTHSFANVGSTTLESISIELK
ncbi:MAG: cupin domain-containing protein [Acidobacteriia bacterium]|nr:cupin domain-containing protein [Terriglobia bacterium]